MFGSFITIASCDSAAQPTGASWPAIAFAQRLQCHSAPPKPQRVKEKFSVPDLSGLSGTGTGTCLFPSMTSRRLRDEYRQAHYYGQDGWTDSQSCRRPILHVPDSVCDWLVLAQAAQARHVARCTLLVARYSLLVGRCLWGGSNTISSQPVSQLLTRSTQGPGTPGTKHFEDEMQLHVLHHMDDRGSHE